MHQSNGTLGKRRRNMIFLILHRRNVCYFHEIDIEVAPSSERTMAALAHAVEVGGHLEVRSDLGQVVQQENDVHTSLKKLTSSDPHCSLTAAGGNAVHSQKSLQTVRREMRFSRAITGPSERNEQDAS